MRGRFEDPAMMFKLPALLLPALLFAGLAQAEVAPEAVQRGVAAGQSFNMRVTAATPLESLPHLSDPQNGALLRTLFNTDAVVAGRPLGPEKPEALMGWGQVATTVMRRYTDAVKDGPPGAAGLQDEVSLGATFLFRLQVTMSQGVATFIATLPAEQRQAPQRLEALRRSADGTAQMVTGMLTMLADPDMRLENARLLSAALAADIPLLHPMLPPELRGRLMRRASAALSRVKDPVLMRDLAAVQSALARSA